MPVFIGSEPAGHVNISKQAIATVVTIIAIIGPYSRSLKVLINSAITTAL
jgi:hypothetical protein